ncbi:MAG: YkgJ family cysteine cluster protein [Nibricoccus sp.]
MSGQPLPFRPGRLTSNTAFSYACHRCRRCCHDKLIQVNPYEIARLARNRGISTGEFIARHLEKEPYLKRQPDGACVFLGPEGCTVHADRPLVCRVYPLGRHVTSDGRVEFSQLEGHPQSDGIFGADGTIADYLANQEVNDFVHAADLYLKQLQRLFDVWQESSPANTDEGGSSVTDHAPDDPMPDLLDMDKAVTHYCSKNSQSEPADLDARMNLHLLSIEEWLGRQVKK